MLEFRIFTNMYGQLMLNLIWQIFRACFIQAPKVICLERVINFTHENK